VNRNEWPFVCPHCKSSAKENPSGELSSMRIDPGSSETSDDPWHEVFQVVRCPGCKYWIPAHLGNRWDGISLEEAQEEWKEVYFAGASRRKNMD
jgi:hypothetical protein